jgi:sugar O-acyltransferase (sialic acid O-acetyltransferase NeuD family)
VAAVIIGPDAVTGATTPMRVLVYGGGGHSAQCIDLLRVVDGVEPAAIVDDGLAVGDEVLGVPVIGGADELAKARADGIEVAVNAVGGIASPDDRRTAFERLAEAGFTLATIVHPTAYVEPSATLAPGAQVFAQSYVGSRASVGMGVLLNAGVVVSHDSDLAEGANVSPGALLAGGVDLGRWTRIGMGATVNVGLTVGDGARVGNGATVKADVPPDGVVRAGTIWPPRAAS